MMDKGQSSENKLFFVAIRSPVAALLTALNKGSVR